MFMRPFRSGLAAVLLVSLALVVSAQNAQKTLTTDDVVKMVAAGLPESTIVQVIQKGPTAFDTSPDSLIKLKQQGVTPWMMEAMLGVNSTGTGKSAPTSVSSSSPKGVFLQAGNDWKRIEEVSSIEVRAVGGIASQMTLGLKESRVICVFRGEKAELQLTERRPVFRISGLGASARDVYIVAMRLNTDRRDLEMGRAGLLKKTSFGFRKRDIRDVEVKRLGDDLLEATPKQDLEPGEYIMVLGGAGNPVHLRELMERRGTILESCVFSDNAPSSARRLVARGLTSHTIVDGEVWRVSA